MKLVDKDLHVKDVHEIFLEFFKTSNKSFLTEGDWKEFRIKVFFTIVVLAILKMMIAGSYPSIFGSILAILFVGVFVELLVRHISYVNKAAESGPFGILKLIGISAGVLILIGGLLGI